MLGEEVFQAVARSGVAYVPGALDARLCRTAAREIAGASFDWLPESLGVATQRGRYIRVAEPGPAMRAIRERTVAAARSSGVRGLATWWPNDVYVLALTGAADGITPHRDHSRYRRLVVVYTLTGRGTFTIHDSRDGPAAHTSHVCGGDAVLLRAPGLAGHRDGRPHHAVAGASGTRLSLGLRMDVRS